MKGKNVDELIAQTNNQSDQVFYKALKGLIEISFPDYKLSTLSSDGKLKVHVKSIDTDHLIALGDIAKSDQEHFKITLKRSGYGITIMFELKK